MRSRPKIVVPPHLAQIVPWTLWLLLVALCTFLLKGPLFTIKHAVCLNATGGQCPEVLDAEIKKTIGQGSLFYDPSPLVARLHQALPVADELTAVITLPDTLTLRLSEQVMVANLKTATNSATLLVGRDHRIVAEVPEPQSELPTIYAAVGTGWRAGDSIADPPVVFALSLLATTARYGLPITQLTIHSAQEITATLPDNRTAVFSSLEDISRQVTSLQLILDKATMTSDTKVIDVRFEKPVLKPS